MAAIFDSVLSSLLQISLKMLYMSSSITVCIIGFFVGIVTPIKMLLTVNNFVWYFVIESY